MLSREVMKAAEKLNHMLETMPLSQWTDEVGYDDVKPILKHTLAHRADYDAEGRPLEVDEGFAKEMGFESPADENGFFWRTIPGGKVGVDCTPQYPSLMFVDADGDQTIFPAPKTRPQLRALIEAMGR